MFRKLTAATLALTGGVYLLAGPAHASNMGFKLERSFAVVSDGGPTGPRFKNFYLVSFPLFNGLGDVANSSVGGDKCAAGPDGIVDSVDAVCDLWTDKTIPGSFAMQWFNRDTCLFVVTPAFYDPFLGAPDVGAPFPLDRDFGYAITVASDEPIPPQNRAVIVGSHDPAYAGRDVRRPASGCAPLLDIISVPYHTMYQEANEILCGLKGVAWVDLNGDDNPDTCPDGIFDNLSSITVGFFDNIDDNSLPPYGDNEFRFRGAAWDEFAGEITYIGPNFSLVPGEGYLVTIDPLHTTTTWVSPHF